MKLTAADYLQRADEATMRAASSDNLPVKSFWLDIANQWNSLAQSAFEEEVLNSRDDRSKLSRYSG